MKKDEIPQDESTLEDKNIRELCYAVDENGEYTTGLSTGWKAKSIALDLTMQELNQRIAKAKQAVYDNKKSPIYYFMLLTKMDLGILSSYVGRRRWIVKRHFKPRVFKRLKPETIQKYADIFEVEVDQITDFNE